MNLRRKGASGGKPPKYQRLKVKSAAMTDTLAAVRSAKRSLNRIKAGYLGQGWR